jgi:hypothetical protein
MSLKYLCQGTYYLEGDKLEQWQSVKRSNLFSTLQKCFRQWSISLRSSMPHLPKFALFLCYLNRKHVWQFMHQDVGKILTSETSQHSTNFDHPLHFFQDSQWRDSMVLWSMMSRALRWDGELSRTRLTWRCKTSLPRILKTLHLFSYSSNRSLITLL